MNLLYFKFYYQPISSLFDHVQATISFIKFQHDWQESIKKTGDHFVHTCIDLYNSHIPGMRTIGSYHANTLTLGFVAALGQAR